MKVVLFCGGFGTRFKEETELRPKPMIKIGGKPILWHIMKYYAHFGFKEFVLCTGYKSEVIKDYFYHYKLHNCDFTVKLGADEQICFHGEQNLEDWTVTVVDTGLNTLKGGRLKRGEPYVDGDTFMLTYGDGVADVDLHKLLDFHRSHGKLATMTGVYPPSLFGELAVDAQGKALMFSEKPQTTKGLINGGFFVLDRKVFDYLSPDESCDFERGPLDEICAQGQLMIYRHTGNWSCMDTQRDNDYLNRLWASNQAFWKVW